MNIHFKTCILILSIIINCILGYIIYNHKPIIQHDIEYIKSEPVVITEYERVVDTLRIVDPKIMIIRDTVYQDGQQVITDSLIIPITQQQYVDTIVTSSTSMSYNAFVSGYSPRLDSINFKISPPIAPSTKKKIHHGFNIGINMGYNVIERHPYVGIGVSYGLQFNLK